MFFPPQLWNYAVVVKYSMEINQMNRQCAQLMSTGQNKVTSQLVSYFKYCKSINMYDHPHDTGDQSRHKNLLLQSNSASWPFYIRISFQVAHCFGIYCSELF